MTTTVLNTNNSDENKIPNTSNLVTKIVLDTKIIEADYSKYITTQEFNQLTAENFAARLKQSDLVNKTDCDNKLASFNRRITANKTKHLDA